MAHAENRQSTGAVSSSRKDTGMHIVAGLFSDLHAAKDAMTILQHHGGETDAGGEQPASDPATLLI